MYFTPKVFSKRMNNSIAYFCRWILATLVVFGAMQQCGKINSQDIVFCPWSSSKNYHLEYLSLIKTLRAEIFPEGSCYFAHDDSKVATSELKWFSRNSKIGDRNRVPLLLGELDHVSYRRIVIVFVR